MGLLIRGKTRCSLCEQVITDGEEVVSFGPFVSNGRDPLLKYSDQSFHADDLWRQPDAEKAMARWNEVRSRSVPEARRCAVCRMPIANPDEYFAIGFLSERMPAAEFNYTQLHRAHIGSWTRLDEAVQAIRGLKSSSEWAGPGLDRILETLLDAQKARLN
jgi:hypothetical protein